MIGRKKPSVPFSKALRSSSVRHATRTSEVVGVAVHCLPTRCGSTLPLQPVGESVVFGKRRERTTYRGRDPRWWPLLLLLLAVVLLPTACLLWMMSRAIDNERSAVRQVLAEACRTRPGPPAKELGRALADKGGGTRSRGGREAGTGAFRSHCLAWAWPISAVCCDKFSPAKLSHDCFPALVEPPEPIPPRGHGQASWSSLPRKLPPTSPPDSSWHPKRLPRWLANASDINLAARAYRSAGPLSCQSWPSPPRSD